MPFIAKYTAGPSLKLKKCPLFASLFTLAQKLMVGQAKTYIVN
jgi:hypothetical protein